MYRTRHTCVCICMHTYIYVYIAYYVWGMVLGLIDMPNINIS